MSKNLTLTMPDEVAEALQDEADRTGRSPEQIGVECIVEHTRRARPGATDAAMPFFGAWKMTAEERSRIEREIEEDRRLVESEA